MVTDEFFRVGEELPDAPAAQGDAVPALEKLGPSPFPKSGFPFLGFLATTYDHISTHVPGAAAEGESVGG